MSRQWALHRFGRADFRHYPRAAQERHTILLVEQNAQMALSVANRAYVLETGKISMSGDAQELLHNDAVRKAYLGA